MKKAFLIFQLLSLVLTTFSQHTWIEGEFSTDISKKLELSVSPEIRFKEQFELNEYFIESGLEYKFHKYFQFGTGYRFGFNINKKNVHEPFGRFYMDAKTGLKFKHFNPKFRVRFTNADDFGEDNEATNYLRYKLELEYNFKKLNLEPYVLYEWYHDLQAKEFIKTRFEAGLMQKINKQHKIGAYFRINNYLNNETAKRNIIGVTYKFNL